MNEFELMKGVLNGMGYLMFAILFIQLLQIIVFGIIFKKISNLSCENVKQKLFQRDTNQLSFVEVIKMKCHPLIKKNGKGLNELIVSANYSTAFRKRNLRCRAKIEVDSDFYNKVEVGQLIDFGDKIYPITYLKKIGKVDLNKNINENKINN